MSLGGGASYAAERLLESWQADNYYHLMKGSGSYSNVPHTATGNQLGGNVSHRIREGQTHGKTGAKYKKKEPGKRKRELFPQLWGERTPVKKRDKGSLVLESKKNSRRRRARRKKKALMFEKKATGGPH